jgi:uncharacterized coiled-coil protein SlyX
MTAIELECRIAWQSAAIVHLWNAAAEVYLPERRASLLWEAMQDVDSIEYEINALRRPPPGS